jgi:hypothetical protein
MSRPIHHPADHPLWEGKPDPPKARCQHISGEVRMRMRHPDHIPRIVSDTRQWRELDHSPSFALDWSEVTCDDCLDIRRSCEVTDAVK